MAALDFIPNHGHSLDTIVGYDLVICRSGDPDPSGFRRPVCEVVAVVEGANRYAEALERTRAIVREGWNGQPVLGAYPTSRHSCGCRFAAMSYATETHEVLLERLLAEGHNVGLWADDPFALRGYAGAVGAL